MWDTPNAKSRRAALGSMGAKDSSDLVAACRNAPCEPRFCQLCRTRRSHNISQVGRCAHSSSQPGYFEPKISPKRNDWLGDGMPGEDERQGESFDQFLKATTACQLAASFSATTPRSIYLCNLDDEGGETTESAEEPVFAMMRKTMEKLREFVELYFGLPCSLLGPLDAAERQKLYGRSDPLPQLSTGPLESLLYSRKQNTADAFAVVGVTMVDLYPKKSWNYVFGEANPTKGVGVFSFARHTHLFDWALEEAASQEASGERAFVVEEVFSSIPPSRYYNPREAWLCFGANDFDAQNTVLLRALKILAHEIGHLFQLQHCVFYQCAMNGVNHVGELDQSPLHLCPICLRKLNFSVCAALQGRSPCWIASERYRKLGSALERWGQLDNAIWYNAASERCIKGATPKKRLLNIFKGKK